MHGQEMEVKFYLSDRVAYQERLIKVQAKLKHPRLHEINLRFDTPDLSLSNTSQVLRLRKDQHFYITYKDPGDVIGGVRNRREIEFHVDDFDAAREMLEALGYQVILVYEKYRTTYQYQNALITLDEMPYGNFTEIEGEDAESIRAISQILELNWENRILDSYTMLFEKVKNSLHLSFRDLDFEHFQNIQVLPEHLGVRPGDKEKSF